MGLIRYKMHQIPPPCTRPFADTGLSQGHCLKPVISAEELYIIPALCFVTLPFASKRSVVTLNPKP